MLRQGGADRDQRVRLEAVRGGDAQRLRLGLRVALGVEAVDDHRVEAEADGGLEPAAELERLVDRHLLGERDGDVARASRVGEHGGDLLGLALDRADAGDLAERVRRGQHREAVAGGGRVDDHEVVGAVVAVPALELGELEDLRDRDHLARARRRRDEVLERRGAREQAHGRPAAELLGEPLLEREVGVDRDRPQVLGQLDLDLALDALALERARDPILRRDLADDRAPPGRRGGEPERGGDGRLPDAALAGDVEQMLVEQPRCHGVGAEDDDSGDRSGAHERVRDLPAHAPAPRPDLLLGDPPAARGDPPRDPRPLRLRAHRRRDRRRPAAPRGPAGAPRRARRLGGRARGRPRQRAARRSR